MAKVSQQAMGNFCDFISEPRRAFWVALTALLLFQVWHVGQDPWFWLPPKPVGDGLDYENIGFHVYSEGEYRINTTNPEWRSVYEAAQNSGEYQELLERDGRDLISTGRPPLFPTLIAGAYELLGRGPNGFALVRLFNACCLSVAGALAVWCAAWVSKDLCMVSQFAERRAAVLRCSGAAATFLMAASNRTLNTYALDFLTEPCALLLMQLFVVSGVWTIGCSRRESCHLPRSTLVALLYGVLLGIMILCRSIFVVWLPGVVGLVHHLFRTEKSPGTFKWTWATTGIMCLAACTICAPWWARNMVVLQSLRPLGTQGAITMLGGYSDAALANHGDWQFDPEKKLRAQVAAQHPQLSGVERELVVSEAATKRVRSWLAENITEIPGLMLKRIRTHWNPYQGRALVWKLLALIGLCTLCSTSRILARTFRITDGSHLDNDALPQLEAQRRVQRYLIWFGGLLMLSTIVAAALYTVGGRFLVPCYGILFTLSGLGVSWCVQQVWRILELARRLLLAPEQ